MCADSVDVASFEALALPSITCPEERLASGDGSNAVIIIDEIGRMELHSVAFQAAISRLLASPEARVVGAITAPIYGHRVPFCDEVAAHSHVCVQRITQKTRDAVREGMAHEAISLASAASAGMQC